MNVMGCSWKPCFWFTFVWLFAIFQYAGERHYTIKLDSVDNVFLFHVSSILFLTLKQVTLAVYKTFILRESNFSDFRLW